LFFLFFFLFPRRCSFVLLSLIITSSFLYSDVDGERNNTDNGERLKREHEKAKAAAAAAAAAALRQSRESRAEKSREKKIKKSKAPVTQLQKKKKISRPFETNSHASRATRI
jgi:hypothetical protein